MLHLEELTLEERKFKLIYLGQFIENFLKVTTEVERGGAIGLGNRICKAIRIHKA